MMTAAWMNHKDDDDGYFIALWFGDGDDELAWCCTIYAIL